MAKLKFLLKVLTLKINLKYYYLFLFSNWHFYNCIKHRYFQLHSEPDSDSVLHLKLTLEWVVYTKHRAHTDLSQKRKEKKNLASIITARSLFHHLCYFIFPTWSTLLITCQLPVPPFISPAILIISWKIILQIYFAKVLLLEKYSTTINPNLWHWL